MNTQHTMFVCRTCASTWQDGKRIGESGGQQLLNQLLAQSQNWSLVNEFTIKPVECMSACTRACAIALTAPGKITYLFGDLSPSAETLPATSAAVLECASLYFTKPDGLMAWSERPKLLQKGILAKIPSCT